MAVTLQEVKDLLKEQDLKFRDLPNDDGVSLGFRLENSTYRDRDGDSSIQVVIKLGEEGTFLLISAPGTYFVAECAYREVVFELLLQVQAHSRMLRFSYDSTDGEIRPNIELWLEDSKLTSKQFHRLLRDLLMGVDRFDPMIRRAMKTGVASLDPPEQASVSGSPEEIQRLLHLAAWAGGVDRLERLLVAKATRPDQPGTH